MSGSEDKDLETVYKVRLEIAQGHCFRMAGEKATLMKQLKEAKIKPTKTSRVEAINLIEDMDRFDMDNLLENLVMVFGKEKMVAVSRQGSLEAVVDILNSKDPE